MIGPATSNAPNYSRKESAETILAASQSPSFAFFAETSQSTDESTIEFEERSTLKIRFLQKRPKSVTPSSIEKLAHPIAKKLKEETKSLSRSEETIADYIHQIKENAKSKKTVNGLNVEHFEMYAMLCKSATLIPVPHTLLPKFNEFGVLETSKITSSDFSVKDRKEVLLSVFSLRSSLKVSEETIHLGAAILDKCLDLMAVNKETLKELAAVSVVIASKIEDVDYLTLAEAVNVGLVRDRPISLIAKLEKLVLRALEFDVTFPTPLNFATYMLVHLCACQTKRNLAHYFLELSVLYVHNRLFSSDVVAFAATWLAFTMDTEPGHSISRVLTITETELRLFTDKHRPTKRKQSMEVMKTMIDLFIVAAGERHSVFEEYSKAQRNFVSTRRVDPRLLEMLQGDSN